LTEQIRQLPPGLGTPVAAVNGDAVSWRAFVPGNGGFREIPLET
jgi:hypothetical protein